MERARCGQYAGCYIVMRMTNTCTHARTHAHTHAHCGSDVGRDGDANLG